MAALTAPETATGVRSTDLALAGLVVAVIVMMALPLPPWVIDILVATNISCGVVLLMVALFVPTPLAISTLPSVLLITTLFRISLSVATTRQILLHAQAGDIINAFGRLVVGGSLIVGLVVFLIITIVQFIVIAKGAERVAEVGARFTLDALPGKQMAIDSDMRAGLLTQAEALVRRRELVLESQFYGAMDGAMKFVKGDAIAGIVIVLVNLLGGIAIGTIVMDLGFGPAVQRYSVLSIGDGLVTQIPALFVSIAAGIAITRTAPDKASNLGDQITRQFGAHPRALLLSAGVMVLFAAVPGFPTLTFLLLGAAVGGAGLVRTRAMADDLAQRARESVAAAARDGENAPVSIEDALPEGRPVSAFRLELGVELAGRIGAPGLQGPLETERRRLRERFGLPFPGLVLLRRGDLAPDEYCMAVQDLPDERGLLPADVMLLVTAPGSADAAAIEAVDLPVPASLKPARWIAAAQAEAARAAGGEVLSAAEVLARVVVSTMQRNPTSLMGVQEVRAMLKDLEGRHPDLVREAQQIMPLPRLADLMTALTRERVPLVDLPALLGAITTAGQAGVGDSAALYENVRMALSRGILAQRVADRATTVPAAVLHVELEQSLRATLTSRPDGPLLALPPGPAEALQKAVARTFDELQDRGVRTLVVPADLRRATSRLLRGCVPHVGFLSYEEVHGASLKVDAVATITQPAEGAAS